MTENGSEETGEIGWIRNREEGADYPVLEGSETAEVAIVGGGYTGLSTALHLAEAGRDVIVLEAAEPGAGASGRNAGHVVPFWARKTPEQACRTLGREMGDKLNRLIAGSTAELFALVDRLKIDCDQRPGGHLSMVRSQKAMDQGRNLVDQWQAAGARVRCLGQDEVRELVDSPMTAGGWMFEDGGSINPLDYAQGLAAAVVRAGGLIYARSAVTGIAQADNGWTLATGNGSVKARQLIMATNAYEAGIWPGLAHAGYAFTCGMLMSEPVEHTVSFKWRGPWAWIDNKTLFGAMFTGKGEIVTSVLPGPGRITREALAHVADAKFARYFPRLGQLRWANAWSGRFMLTPDGFPRLVKLADNAHAAFGYNGNGIAAATVFGRQLAGTITHASELCVPVTRLKKAPLARLFPWLFRNLLTPVVRVAGG